MAALFPLPGDRPCDPQHPLCEVSRLGVQRRRLFHARGHQQDRRRRGHLGRDRQSHYGGSWVSPLPWPTALAIDPKTSTTLYASWRVVCDPNVQGGIPCQEQNWTSKSTDRGASWFGISGFSAYTFAIV